MIEGSALRLPFLAVLAFLSIPVSWSDTESGNLDTEAVKLLHNAFYLGVDVSVSESGRQRDLLNRKLSKVTIPGRKVEIDLRGFESRMNIGFTIYPVGDRRLILLARCETWIAGNYEISISSMPVALKDEILYFPLGRPGSEEGTNSNPVEIVMRIDIMPFMETLDDEKLKHLKETINNKSAFKIILPEGS